MHGTLSTAKGKHITHQHSHMRSTHEQNKPEEVKIKIKMGTE